ncbi:MAG: arginine deiminase-related protein [Spirochaetes bacterium]|nr:arginine deiminase-related protein [Spirochaetota bacterium]
MFTKAITRRPCRAMINGITTVNLGKPDYDLALKQHDQYIKALETCGLTVEILEADEGFPDSCFVEDTAVLIPECAILTRPGDSSRMGEVELLASHLKSKFNRVFNLKGPATLDGGDVLLVEKHFYIGLSKRTNAEGIRQFKEFVEPFGYDVTGIPVKYSLHLKSGLVYLNNNHMLIINEYHDDEMFRHYHKLNVKPEEKYSANCLWLNDKVLVANGFPATKEMVINAGYNIITLDMTEFQKIDGALTCLSLRY